MRVSCRLPPSFSRSLCSSSSPCPSWSLQILLKRGFAPTLHPINQFLLFLSTTHRFTLITHFFSQMTRNHIHGDSQTHSIFAWALLKLNRFEEAERFVKSHAANSSRIWDSLIRVVCIDGKDPEKAFSLLRESLTDYGVLPSSFTFCSLIHCFSSQGKMSRAIEVLQFMNGESVKYPYNNFVCSSVISGFCKIGKPELAIGFFQDSLCVGALEPNVVTYTALVTALSNLGRVNEISDLASRMVKEGLALDVVFYSSWISGYFSQGMLMDALGKHWEMVKLGFGSDAISDTILIDGLSKQGSVEKAVGFFLKMVEAGLQPNLVTYSALMLGFCKKGKVVEACSLYETVKSSGIKLDEYVYAILVDGLCRQGNFKRVAQLLDEMETEGVRPSLITYNTLINGLCNAGKTSDADELSKRMNVDVVTYSTLLHGYIEEANVVRILEVIKRSKDDGIGMDVIMCNILIRANFMVGAFEEAYILYKGMQAMDLVADSVTCCTMIDGYCKVDRIDEALQIFDEFRRKSISSAACYNCLISWLCKKNMVDVATQVFLELIEKGLTLDVGIYMILLRATLKESPDRVLNLIGNIESLGLDIFGTLCDRTISLLCKRNFVIPATQVYSAARRNCSILSSKSYYCLLRQLIRQRHTQLSRPILSSFVKQYGLIELRVNRILLHFLCLKDIPCALKLHSILKENNPTVSFPFSVLKEMTKHNGGLTAYELIMGAKDDIPGMDMVGYSIVVDGLIKGGHTIKALDICELAETKQVSLNIFTYNSVINGLCQQGCFVEAFRLFDSLERMNLRPSEVTYATLIDSLCREGYLMDAQQLVDRMVLGGYKKGAHVYNSLLNGYCKTGEVEEALMILNNMDAEHLRPGGFTVSAVINGYCQRGDMEQALRFFSECQLKGTSPDFLGFLFLIRGLCTKGRMEEARSILREMLKSQPVLEVLNHVNYLAETDSIDSFLVSLCDQGSIKEAVMVLEEVSDMFYPHSKRYGLHHEQEDLGQLAESMAFSPVAHKRRIDLQVPYYDSTLEYSYDPKGGSESNSFDSYSSLIASLCSKGELGEANKLAEDMLTNFVGK
ncbi:Pentatricopeptide repeat-containing protein At5g57250, mitochondrial [Linum grandiflorum]